MKIAVLKMLIFLLILLILPMFQKISEAKSTLLQIHAVVRHGERSPTETYKNDPYLHYNWPNGWGQLTNKGKYEMFYLGQKLAEVYKDFVPTHYSPTDLKVFSSYADRCQASAQCFFAGFYPPRGEEIWNPDLLWQPIPVVSIARAVDTIIAQKVKCKKWDEQFKALFQSDELRNIDSENEDLYRFLTEKTGIPIENIAAVESLFNTLEIEKINNLTLPSWVGDVSWDNMKLLASKTLAIYTNDDYMKKIKGGYLMRQILNSMKAKRDDTKEPSIYFYAAHDISMVSLLRAMGLIDLLKPGFGASFIVELHKNNSQFEVKMFYRDDVLVEAEEFKLKDCANPCTLEEFERILAPIIPGDYNKECENVDIIPVIENAKDALR